MEDFVFLKRLFYGSVLTTRGELHVLDQSAGHVRVMHVSCSRQPVSGNRVRVVHAFAP